MNRKTRRIMQAARKIGEDVVKHIRDWEKKEGRLSTPSISKIIACDVVLETFKTLKDDWNLTKDEQEQLKIHVYHKYGINII